jgi:hypothetical protein
VAQRLLNIERIITHATSQSITLGISQMVSIPVLQTMRELNQYRNGFSHSAAQSESQAQTWIGECYEDVIDIFGELRGLEQATIFRYLGQTNINTLKCETFRGHGFTKTIKEIPLTEDQVRDSQQYFQQGQVLISYKECVFSLRPMIYYKEDSSGHTTKLCMFRKKSGDIPNRRVEFEVVGEAERLVQDWMLFQRELNEIGALFVLEPD